MSDENRDYQEPQEEAELSSEDLEQASGGCFVPHSAPGIPVKEIKTDPRPPIVILPPNPTF